VRAEGWKGIKNGKLLDAIQLAGFEAFLTNDKRMDAEQHLQRRPFAVLILSACNWPRDPLACRQHREGGGSVPIWQRDEGGMWRFHSSQVQETLGYFPLMTSA
jgi:hypothetical protein